MARKKEQIKEISDDSDYIKRCPNPTEWTRISKMYIEDVPLDKICKSFPLLKLDSKTILRKMSVTGVTAKKKAMEDRVVDSMFKISEQEREKVNQQCINLFDKGQKAIDALLDKFIEELSDPNMVGKPKATAYNLDMLMSGATKIQKGYSVAYGMDENNRLYEKQPEVLTIEGISVDKI